MKRKLKELNELNGHEDVNFPWRDFKTALKQVAKDAEQPEFDLLLELLPHLN